MGRDGDKLVQLKISTAMIPQYVYWVHKEMSNPNAQCWDVDHSFRLSKSEKVSPSEVKFTLLSPMNDELYVEFSCVEEKGRVTVYWRVTLSSNQMGAGMVARMFKSKFKNGIIATLESFKESESIGSALDKEDKKTIFLNAIADIKMNRIADAARVFEKLMSVKPNEKALLVALAACSQDTNIPLAYSLLQRAIRVDPNNAQLVMETAFLAIKMRKIREAVDLMNHLLDIDPGNLFTFINLSALLVAAKRYDRVIQLCNQGLQIHPEDPSLIQNRDAAIDFKNNPNDSKKQIGFFTLSQPLVRVLALEIERIKNAPPEVFEQKPGEGATYAAETFMNMNDATHALEMCEIALNANQQNGDAWLIKGFALQKKSDQDGSLNALQKAVLYLPERADAWFHLGDMFLEVGQVDDAISTFKKALGIAPKDTNIMNNLAVAYRTAKNLPETAQILEQLVELNPYLENVWINLGADYADMGDLGKALKVLDYALELNPDFEPAKIQRDAIKQAMARQSAAIVEPLESPNVMGGAPQVQESKICPN